MSQCYGTIEWLVITASSTKFENRTPVTCVVILADCMQEMW